MGSMMDTGAKDAARKQQEQIAAQKQEEDARLAEEESEVAKRKALMANKAKGRSLLTATSQTGTAGTSENLGG